MSETRREHWAEYLGLAASVIPATIASGLMPAWNVLPFDTWLVIAAVGGGIAGAIATPLWARGLVSGVISGVGVFFGIWLYVVIRQPMILHRVLRFEIVIGALIGWAPGLLLYHAWARPRR